MAVERPSLERDVRDLRKRLEVLERLTRAAGLPVPPWEVDYDTGAVVGRMNPDDLTIDRPLTIIADGTGGTIGLSLDSYSGDGTPDSGGAAIGLDLGGEFISHPTARVKSDGGRAIGVSMDVDAGGADAYGVKGEVDGGDDGGGWGVKLQVAAGAFGPATGAEFEVTTEDGVATGVKIQASGTGSGIDRGLDVAPNILLRVLATEPPADLAGPILYAYDNAGTIELRANIGGTVTTLATA